MNAQGRMSKRMAKWVRVGLVVMTALMIAVMGSGSPRSAHAAGYPDNNAKQVKVHVEQGYTITYLTVSGTNQDGNWASWPPNGPFTCDAASVPISPCPSHLTTDGWWWSGSVTISVKAVPRFAMENIEKSVTSQVTIPSRSNWFGDTVTVHYYPDNNSVSY